MKLRLSVKIIVRRNKCSTVRNFETHQDPSITSIFIGCASKFNTSKENLRWIWREMNFTTLIEETEKMKFLNFSLNIKFCLLLKQQYFIQYSMKYVKISSNFRHSSFSLIQPWTIRHKSTYLFQNPSKKYPIPTYPNRYFAREHVIFSKTRSLPHP